MQFLDKYCRIGWHLLPLGMAPLPPRLGNPESAIAYLRWVGFILFAHFITYADFTVSSFPFQTIRIEIVVSVSIPISTQAVYLKWQLNKTCNGVVVARGRPRSGSEITKKVQTISTYQKR